MKNNRMISHWIRVALLLSEISRSMAWKKKKLASLTFIHDRHFFKAVLSIKDKDKGAHDIVFQMICKIVVSGLNIVFLILSVLLDFTLH